jgi:hypothetical protein
MDGAVCSNEAVGTFYVQLGFPVFFANSLQSYIEDVRRIPQPAILRLLNIACGMCAEDFGAKTSFYNNGSFDLCMTLLSDSIANAPLQSNIDFETESRAVHLLGLFLAPGGHQVLLTEVETNSVFLVFMRMLDPMPREHTYADITSILEFYFNEFPAFAVRRFSELSLSGSVRQLSLWRILGSSILSDIDVDRCAALSLLADAIGFCASEESEFTDLLLDAVDVPSVIGELVESRTLLCLDNADVTLAILRLLEVWIRVATEIPADVEPSDVIGICEVVCDEGSLCVKTALFRLLRGIFEKGRPEFLFELVTPQFTQWIFDAASGQADDILEPFLGLLESYLARFGKQVGLHEDVDAIFKDWMVGLLCETTEVSSGFQAQAQHLLATYYGEALQDRSLGTVLAS